MGPAERNERQNLTRNFVGWGRRIRTPATWSRATRPTTRRSPKTPRRRANYSIRSMASQRTTPLTNGGLQRATGTESRNLGRRDLDLAAGTRVAAVAGGASAYDERAESADGDPPSPPQRLVDPAHEGVHRLLG